jgi:anaerobic ribonucleoside-triphosphate reductase activating protein
MTGEPDGLTMQIAQVVPCTEAEGPGRRFAVWFQGCPLRCPGCCNPEYLPFKGGDTSTLREMAEWMRRARDEGGVEGITLLGGEPTAHAPAAAGLARAARGLALSVMTFSGYTLEQLRETTDPAVGELIALTDILVDGPFDRDKPDTERRWIGSRNQRVHFLTDRYHFDEQWRRRNTLEIRVDRTGITVNGFPAAHAVGLWKGWERKKPAPASPGPAGTDAK